MSNKQKTAVDYLYFMMSNPLYSGGNNQKLFQQAKELEKQQKIDAWENGYEHGACVNEDENKYHGIQYYNEIYEQ